MVNRGDSSSPGEILVGSNPTLCTRSYSLVVGHRTLTPAALVRFQVGPHRRKATLGRLAQLVVSDALIDVSSILRKA